MGKLTPLPLPPLVERLAALGARAEDLRRTAVKMLPKEATVVGGKYNGRLGKITGAILWDGDGLLIGFYVYRATKPGGPINREVLNSDVESRRYRKPSELNFLDQGELVV